MTFNAGIWTRNIKKSDPYFWKARMKAMKRMLNDILPDVICFQEFWFPMNLYIPKVYHKVLFTGLEHPIYVKKGVKANLFGSFHFRWSKAIIEGVSVYCIHSRWTRSWIESDCNQIYNDYVKNSIPHIVTGDFNNDVNVINELLDYSYSARLMLSKDVENTYVHFHDSSRCGELDHFFVNWTLNIKDYSIIHDSYGVNRISDHYPVCLTINTEENEVE